MVADDDLDQLQDPRLDQALEILVLLLLVLAGVVAVDVDLYEEGEGAEEVDLLADLGEVLAELQDLHGPADLLADHLVGHCIHPLGRVVLRGRSRH